MILRCKKETDDNQSKLSKIYINTQRQKSLGQKYQPQKIIIKGKIWYKTKYKNILQLIV